MMLRNILTLAIAVISMAFWVYASTVLIRATLKVRRFQEDRHRERLLLIRATVNLNWAAYRMQDGIPDPYHAATCRAMVQEIKKAINWEPAADEFVRLP